MHYEIHPDKLAELNAIVGQQGGPATSKVSDSFAALEVAIKSGNKADAQASFDAAVKANKADGAAWDNVQEWHDEVENENRVDEDGGSGAGSQGPAPGIPSNAIEMFRAGDGHLQTGDNPPLDVTIHGKNYAAHVLGGAGGSAPWQYFVGTMDGNHSSVSCDGKKLAYTVTDTPTDPGMPGYNNTALVHHYKAGQCCNFRIGEGGYTDNATAIFSIN